jgi:hypothetical protein
MPAKIIFRSAPPAARERENTGIMTHVAELHTKCTATNDMNTRMVESRR